MSVLEGFLVAFLYGLIQVNRSAVSEDSHCSL